MELEPTGERYLPNCMKGQIKYEHLHRYALSIELARDKQVLDIASGEGYGSASLSKFACSVVGVDIDSKSVEYANQKYGDRPNLEFVVGACEAIPLPSQSVDIVTSFETIEHHNKHEEMMQEIKRVLKPGGLVIISSPNRLTYSDLPEYSNPFHVKELYDYQFISLLNRHFKHVKIYGQRLATGSFVFPLKEPSQPSFKAYTFDDSEVNQKVCSLEAPIYFIAICSDEVIDVQPAIDSIYIDKPDDLFKENQVALAESQSQLHQTKALLSQYQSQLHQTEVILMQCQSQLQDTEAVLEESQSQLQDIEAVLEESQSQLHQTQTELAQSQSQLHQTQTELAQSQSQLHQAQTELAQSQSQLHETQAVLEQSQSQLQDTESVLEQSQSQLHETQVELEQSQSQLHETHTKLAQSLSQLQDTESVLEQSLSQLQDTESVLEQSQYQLHQTQTEWEQSQYQLHQTQTEWEQSQSQLHKTQTELAQSQSQLHETQAEVKQSQSQQAQTEAELAQAEIKLKQSQSQQAQTASELAQAKAQLHETDGVLEQSQSQLHQTQEVLERLLFQQSLAATQTDEGQIPMQYKLLLWDAWYAYRKGDMAAVAQCLQQSLKCTPLSRTETLVNWLESFAKFSSEKGYEFDSYSLTSSVEWKQLMRSVTTLKAVVAS
ncbi:MAG: methyltransferase domain-containing protein [Microcoleus sp. PH2017_07_MST_O_A]|uniref:methyltransferase domain-containing protein n=1 Tax=unclassified Microcoleus TaxID=2642155 RepID=UPI001DA69A27|nr:MULTISPECIES: methyltransferase domain-containing protein [unclassified Microcoleus]MCC3419285.1 methyltransferase domain-containing protein [Microcoleus sp. PH2017_07_MST_O_A]MCC3510848.1 methyltransferase domain-containing protein [Microcoleus sp. PH2017_17_BER_D_A]TAE68956.1 MAG: methyltransferase domain-containing protein [Oscillatoriales cyanobacterium]MCC3448055.1 methyltransferase domain-containing protein [Microcoleus sp. PH2017_09_SFU_O_A]MCC3628967.1 methyltransferase domain-conta